jgi:hypothetical protein
MVGREFRIHERHGLPVAIERQHVEMGTNTTSRLIVINKILAVR